MGALGLGGEKRGGFPLPNPQKACLQDTEQGFTMKSY